ncbi:MAG TPA: diguanylate cyclase [Solirubrobacteraceae bacterium]|nr:diguanylate cyclase [Solirubrobacteraceae bacterium]
MADPVLSEAAHAIEAGSVMSVDLLTALVSTAPVGAAVLDTTLHYRWVNSTLCAMNGHSAEEHLGRLPSELLGELGSQLETLLRRVLHDNDPLLNHCFSVRRPGAAGYWMGSYYPLRNAAGELIGVGAILTDVTEHERSSARERQFLTGLVQVAQAIASHADSQEVLGVVAREAAEMLDLDGAVVASFQPDGVSLEGRWGNVTAVSEPGTVLPTATMPVTELVRGTGQPQRQVTEAPDAFGFRSRVAAPILVNGALWGAVKAGSPRMVALPDDAEGRLGRFADLVGLAVANATEQRQLIEQASRDALTGLRNRRAFQERMASEAQRATRHVTSFSLVLLDIDEFKAVNDIHGHDVGDEVLVEVARRLCEEVRAEDLLARIGGEEFAWILPDVGSRGALLAAERARLLIADTPFREAGPVTVSAGVANFEEAGDADLLFRQADRALYEAKRRGRNRCVRHSDLGEGCLTEPAAGAQSVRVAEQAHALPALRALARAIDAKDPATFRHSERVAQLARELAQLLGWPRPRALALRDAALLHDVGKIGIPEQLLFKPGRLTSEEYEQVKTHAWLSGQIAREVVSPEQAAWILHHHERWDGGGYPAGLAGEEIPDGAQLLALADAWDAMTVARPYGEPLSPTEALRECLTAAGRQFAPAAVDALRNLEPNDPVPAGQA